MTLRLRFMSETRKKACEYVGIQSRAYELPEETTQEELLALVDRLNEDEEVNGILVQLPLPAHMDEDAVIKRISPKKDVDGFHPQSVGALSIGQSRALCLVHRQESYSF